VEAGAIAYSAVEHAVAKLNADAAAAPSTWRTNYTDGAVAFSSGFGRGTMRWVLMDGQGLLADGTRSPADDRVIADDYAEDLTVYGIGQIGATKRVFSVRLSAGGDALDVLRCAVHTTGGVTLNGPTYIAGGPLSTAGTYSPGTHLRGGGGNETGSKPMPSTGVFDTYKNMATALPTAVAGDGDYSPSTLSATNNPDGDENPEGIYYLLTPGSISSLQIGPSRIKGTLVVEAANSSQILRVAGDILWEPHSSRYPILIAKGFRRVRIEGSVDPFSYGGAEHPSELRGLIHMIGGEEFQLYDAAYIRGCVLVDGAALTVGAVTAVGVNRDPQLLLEPPVGYARGNKLVPAPGSWQWAPVPPGVN
jgi:hypothetical protein